MLKTTRRRSRCTAVLVLAAAACSFARPPRLTRFEFEQVHMGTRFRIILYAPDPATATRASDAAFDRIAKLDNIMSDFRPTSELMRLSDQAGGPRVKVSDDLFRVLSAAQDLALQSDGAFDITVGPVVRVWRLARLQHKVPDPRSLASALELVGYEKLRLDAKARTAQLIKPGMVLDLGAIGKGYAADEALEVLKRLGIRRALVSAGGDIAASNSPPGKKGWLIGVAPLESLDKPPTRFLLLQNSAVSTSGDAERHLDVGGVRYSHIVNPKTGMGLIGHSSVTTVARKGILSDGLATAVSVLGPKKGLDLVRSTPGAGVLFVQQTEGGARTFQLRFPAEVRDRR